jgi:hypothetical protein
LQNTLHFFKCPRLVRFFFCVERLVALAAQRMRSVLWAVGPAATSTPAVAATPARGVIEIPVPEAGLHLGDGTQHLLQGAFVWQSVPMAEALHEVRHCRPVSRAKYRSVLANSEGEVDVVP